MTFSYVPDDVFLLWLGGSDLAEEGKWVWAKSNRVIKVQNMLFVNA
jgi:hypothetical protein